MEQRVITVLFLLHKLEIEHASIHIDLSFSSTPSLKLNLMVSCG